MRAVVVVLSCLLTACGSTVSFAPAGSVTPPPRATSGGNTSWFLDQLAPAPDDGSGTRLTYAVLQVTTSGAGRVLHESAVTMLDDQGSVIAARRPAVYVPIDRLDGIELRPGFAVAGVVGFAVPEGHHPAAIVIHDQGQEVRLDAHR